MLSDPYLGRFLYCQGLLTLRTWATPLSRSRPVRRPRRSVELTTRSAGAGPWRLSKFHRSVCLTGTPWLGGNSLLDSNVSSYSPKVSYQEGGSGEVCSAHVYWASNSIVASGQTSPSGTTPKKIKKSYLRLALEGSAYKSYAISDMKPPHPPHSSCASGLFG